MQQYGSTVSIVHAIEPEPRESITWDPLPRELDRRRIEAEQEMGRLGEEARIKDLNPRSRPCGSLYRTSLGPRSRTIHPVQTDFVVFVAFLLNSQAACTSEPDTVPPAPPDKQLCCGSEL